MQMSSILTADMARASRNSHDTSVISALPANSLSRGQGVALWRQIAASLSEQIGNGRLLPGTRLPTEADFAAYFQVNRHTVRRAMEVLAAQGLVRVEQGRGSFVSEEILDYPLGPRTRFSESIRRQNREPAGVILAIEQMPADAMIADALAITHGRPVLFAKRLCLADQRPVAVGYHYLPVERFPQIGEMLAANPSITAALSASGLPNYRRKLTRIGARMPSVEEARLLEQARSRPVLVTEAVNVDAEGQAVELSIACYAAARMQLLVEN
jgi:GntR family transcriptional regulator, phosphonate transport system regulatory protein